MRNLVLPARSAPTPTLPRERERERSTASGSRSIGLAALLLAVGCGGSFTPELEYGRLDSAAMSGREMAYGVFTPPGWTEEERLPLVVFLHGGGDDHASFDRHGLSRALERATREGRVPRVIMVMPEGNLGFWANWYDGSHRYEDWVMEELVPRVAYEHRTLPCPEYCHVMGVSMGGSGTIRFALHHEWASASIISAPVLDTDQMIELAQNPMLVPLIPMDRIFGPTRDAGARERVRVDDPYARWRSEGDLGPMRLLVAWGDEDRGPIIDTSRRLVRHLETHEVPHEAIEYEGNHSWVSWGPVIEESLRRMVPPSPWAIGPGLAAPTPARVASAAQSASRR